jgi:hypothetical protein
LENLTGKWLGSVYTETGIIIVGYGLSDKRI